MNIPDDNPLFDWVWDAARAGQVEEVKISVGDISARLLLADTLALRHEDDGYRKYGRYLATEWILAHDPHCVAE
ncbi:hypothetical protein [Mycobacterium phage WXIN]|nr:hypothetical protein [Mycobacterium phage WXIN]